jgi:hypothetical protein
MNTTRGLGLAVLFLVVASHAWCQDLPPYLRDRGPGIPTSMFGTYIAKGELFVYPFFEYYRDKDFEYKPDEFGFGLDEDFRGKFRASEGLIFIGYGVSDRLAVEFEAAVISARLEKSPDDPSAMPDVIEESGLGDVEGQIRYRWMKENETRPEVFSYFEATVPHAKSKPLIGTPKVEVKLGAGMIKGFSFGTMTVRAALERTEGPLEAGEYAIEYLRRINDRFRVYTGIEGVQDEVEWISELQIRLSRRATLKLNNAIGITSKATDWAPEVGILFSF